MNRIVVREDNRPEATAQPNDRDNIVAMPGNPPAATNQARQGNTRDETGEKVDAGGEK